MNCRSKTDVAAVAMAVGLAIPSIGVGVGVTGGVMDGAAQAPSRTQPATSSAPLDGQPTRRTLCGMSNPQRLSVGDHVAPFSLPSSLGQPVMLAEVLERGPVVLLWYLFDFGSV